MDESCGPWMSLLQSDERNKYFLTLIAVLTTTWKVITDNDLGQTDVFKVTVLQEQSANRPEESLLEKSTKIGGRIWGHSLLLFSYSLLGISKNNDSLKNRIWRQKDKRQGALKSFSFFLWKYKEDNIPAFFMGLVLQEWNIAKIISRRKFFNFVFLLNMKSFYFSCEKKKITFHTHKKIDFNLIARGNWKWFILNDLILHGTYVLDLQVKVSQVGKAENCWF